MIRKSYHFSFPPPSSLRLLINAGDTEEDKATKQRELRQHSTVVLGLSKLVKKINTGSLHAAFFSSNLEPKFITRQILTLALNKKRTTILLVVPNLEELLDNVFGVKSYTFGLSVDGDLLRFEGVIDIAKTAASRFTIPVSNEKPEGKVESTVGDKRKKPQPLLTSIDFDSLYLKCPGNGKKAWTPSGSTELVVARPDKSTNTAKQWTDFISLNDADSDAESTAAENITDLTEERNQLKAILMSSAKLIPSTKEEQDEEMDCDEEKVEETKKRVSNNSIFLRPEETSGNQWAGLLKPDQVAAGVKKLQKKKKKKEQLLKRKESKEDIATFQPMKIHKIQPNPNKTKKLKKKKNKK